jgi:seryl-tRNA(Sec) selenium transferase
VHEDIFAATFLLDEAKAFFTIEELYDAFSGSNDLGWHAVTAASATTAATKAATAASAAETTAAAAEATAALAAATAAVSTTAAAAAVTITATAATAVTIAAAATAERIEAIFTDVVALITAPTTAPFIITHNLKRTFVSPLNYQSVGNANGRRTRQ